MLRPILLAALLALSACASSRPQDLPAPALPERAGVDPIVAARAEGVRFLAQGEAPPFQLRFYDAIITLQVGDAAMQSFPRPEPRFPRWNGEIYETENEGHRLSVHVRHDRPCPTQAGLHLVEVFYDGVEMDGCIRDL